MIKGMLTFVLVVGLMTGCGQNGDHASSSSQEKDPSKIRVQQSVPEKPEIQNSKQVAKRLENIASSIPQVQSAHCVVLGNTAIVGINVAGDLDRSRVGTIKYSVAEALRKDPYGVHALVTADMDLAARLREIRQDIGNGHPISGFADELSDIIGRIIPQLPKDVLPQHQEPAKTEDREKVRQLQKQR